MKTFYDIIYEWVTDNFGQSEADDPSWNIKALADHLSKSDIDPEELNANTKWLAYDVVKEHFLEEDIEGVAEDKGVKLSKDDMAYIKRQYEKMDDETWEQISCIIDILMTERNK